MSTMITLISQDSQYFDVEEAVVSESETLKGLLEDISVAEEKKRIPVMNVPGDTLGKVIQYCKEHMKAKDSQDEATKKALKEFDSEFVNIDLAPLFELTLAANYLNIKGLLDLTCQTVADTIKGKSPEEVREIFNIENDFTPEEEEKIRNENAWAYEN